ncbi:MAG: CoA-binding protein [Planctomycetes bacterium]|nr:CoA-binding protein [Planctomycetota bacterium]
MNELACEILHSARRVAVLGMSPKPQRTSHDIALYLQRVGYEIVPVNPGHEAILGLPCFPALARITGAVDIVDVFRAAEHEDEVAADILAMHHRPKAVWFQLNAGGYGVEDQLREAGIEVFLDSCIKVVHSICNNRSRSHM